ncbi:glycosyltransferase [Humibacter sp. BT305]|nr:glycosyltransferase [Humibacter sp. BT305]
MAALTLFSGGSTWRSCVTSLLTHTSDSTPIVVFDDAGPSEVAVRELAEVEAELGREIHYFRQPVNRGVVGNLNTAFEMLAPADVIVLNSDIIVGPEWDTRLVEAARSRTDIATATALSANATIFTVEGPTAWKNQLPSVTEFAALSERISANSRRIRPFVPVATSFCTYFARKALNVVGYLDEEYSPGYGEEVDYSLRCVSYGFVHIAADDVYAYHATGESFGEVTLNQRKVDNDQLVSRRFGYWDNWIYDFDNDLENPLNRVRHLTSTLIHGMVVGVDAELIHESLTGTFEGSFALSRKLAIDPRVKRVIWITAPDRVAPMRAMLRQAKVDGIEVTTLHELRRTNTRLDVAFRPYQDFTGHTWPAIAAYADRNVIWHLDLIATSNPHYARDYEDFVRLNTVQRASWENADGIAVLTEHVKSSLESYFLGPDTDSRVFVLPNGAPESDGRRAAGWDVENASIDAIGDSPYILVLGTNYLHKNIPWLMRVGLRLKSMGWDGDFVFAGPTPDSGHSEALEKDLIRMTDAECFYFFGRVSEHDKRRLIAGAVLTVSPSVTEGWGMIPAESVSFGSTPIATHGGGLGDISPADADYLTLEDDETDAATLYALVTDADRRRRQHDLWAEQVREHQWSTSADILIDGFLDALVARRAGGARARYQAPVVAPEGGLRSRLVHASVRVLPVGSRRRALLKRGLGWMLR